MYVNCERTNELRGRKGGRVVTSEGVVGHTEEGDAGGVGSEDVEDVPVLREAQPGLGVGRQLLEDPAGHGADVARDGGELGQHHRAARHQGVHDRHGWAGGWGWCRDLIFLSCP